MYFLAAAIAYMAYIFIAGPPSGKAPTLEAPKRGVELKHKPDRYFAAVYTQYPDSRA